MEDRKFRCEKFVNAVRKRLSRIKGSGLARACRAGQLISLIISDIVGDPLDMIASGPTWPDSTTDERALAVLEKFSAAPPEVPHRVLDFLEHAARRAELQPPFPDNVDSHVIGNNATALAAAAGEAPGAADEFGGEEETMPELPSPGA